MMKGCGLLAMQGTGARQGRGAGQGVCKGSICAGHGCCGFDSGNWRFKLLVSLCFEMLASSCFLLLASLCLQLLKINPLKGSLAAVVLFLLPAVVGLGLQLICLIHMRVVIDLAETQSIGVAERTLHYPMALPSDFWLHQSVY